MNKTIILALLTLLLPATLRAQGNYTVMFYNVENLFDTTDSPDTRDEEYTPEGKRNWNDYKYHSKLKNIYKVIANAGGVQGADIIGLCEIENRKVLNDLVDETPLTTRNYQIVHHESPDRRGIDVGLLFNPTNVKCIADSAIAVQFPFDTARTTRDILYAKMLLGKKDTLHVFVNHWPSRYGGEEKSRPYRKQAALTLRNTCDSLFGVNPKSKIVIMGDFNDTPYNKSLTEVLQADTGKTVNNAAALYNLAAQIKNDGSHKYKGEWAMLDQMIVSGALLKKSKGIYTQFENFGIFKKPFMLTDDAYYTGFYPLRTYRGLTWQNGYSDHMPIVLQLK